MKNLDGDLLFDVRARHGVQRRRSDLLISSKREEGRSCGANRHARRRIQIQLLQLLLPLLLSRYGGHGPEHVLQQEQKRPQRAEIEVGELADLERNGRVIEQRR